MNRSQSRPGSSDQLLLGLLGKGFDGYFKAPDDRSFSDVLAKLDTASGNDERRAEARRR